MAIDVLSLGCGDGASDTTSNEVKKQITKLCRVDLTTKPQDYYCSQCKFSINVSTRASLEGWTAFGTSLFQFGIPQSIAMCRHGKCNRVALATCCYFARSKVACGCRNRSLHPPHFCLLLDLRFLIIDRILFLARPQREQLLRLSL